MSTTTTPSPAVDLSKSRGWLLAGGILSILVGFMAMGSPYLFTVVIAQFIAIFALVSGVISLGLAVFGKHSTHRLLDGVLALVRIAAGVVMLACLASSIAVITLILASFFLVEGAFQIVGAFGMRKHQGWVWTLISGIASVVLGLMVFNRWPSDSLFIIGLLYGINSIFWGVSLLTLGMAAKKAEPAAA